MGKHTIDITNTKPWCPLCTRGYMFLVSVELDATPECEPDVNFRYHCNDCDGVIEFDMDDLSELSFSYIGIKTLRDIARRQNMPVVSKYADED